MGLACCIGFAPINTPLKMHQFHFQPGCLPGQTFLVLGDVELRVVFGVVTLIVIPKVIRLMSRRSHSKVFLMLFVGRSFFMQKLSPIPRSDASLAAGLVPSERRWWSCWLVGLLKQVSMGIYLIMMSRFSSVERLGFAMKPCWHLR